MRFHFLGAILLAGVAVPAIAQQREPVDRRVERLEQELRALQRRAYPEGRGQYVEPEIRPGPVARPDGSLSGDALSGLAARVDSLEAQLRTLTGQVEEQEYRSRRLDEQLTALRTELEGRINRVEQQSRPAPPPPPAPAPREPARPAPAPTPAAAEADPAEEAYNAGYRLWNAGQFAQAQTTLEQAATRYPDSRWISWTRNLQGRAYLDDDKPATAARIFLANYQDNPRGERAADSLYFLGVSLTRLNRRTEACRVYDELEQVYPNMRDFIRTRLPDARAAARCTAGN